jgi:hypothetical protein
MPKLSTEHLGPFARAFREAVTQGGIPIEKAMSFVELVEHVVLEQRAKPTTHASPDQRSDTPPPKRKK